MKTVTMITTLTILLTASIASPSTASGIDPGMRTRPGAAAGPTRVSVELYVLDIAEIDDRAQTFKGDISIRLKWQDPRLARPGESGVISHSLSEIWNPRLRILNQRDVKMHFPQIVRTDPNGLVAYEQRFSGDFTTLADIQRFPFDRRTIGITMGTIDHSPSDISLDFTEATIGRAEVFSIPNWTVGDVIAKTGIFRVIGGREFLQLDIALKCKRESAYYIWSVIIPLILIVMMSWSVFFVNPKRLESQLTLAATSMLTLFAYRFAVSNVLPPVPYLTKMDVFITGSTIFVFLALTEAVTTATLADSGHSAFAERLDVIARAAFPSIFVLFIAITFLV